MWQMVSLFYALPKEKHSDCQKFNMTVQLLPGSSTCVLCLFVCLHELVLYLTAVTFHQTEYKQFCLLCFQKKQVRLRRYTTWEYCFCKIYKAISWKLSI